MPMYPYRCADKHYTEKFFYMGKQDAEIVCSCGEMAKRIYTVPQISVDNTDKVDYTVSAGRNFSNKRELEAWMRERNVHVMDDSYLAAEREEIAAKKDLMSELSSRGVDYFEYLRDKKDSETRQQDELLKKLGVKVEQVEASEYLSEDFSKGWVDTVEGDYVGENGKMSVPEERVQCPYSELTSGAVSNV